MKISITQLCPTLCNPIDCSLPGFSVHGILQTRILKWVGIPFSRGSSWLRDRTWVSCTAGRFSTVWATREAPSLGLSHHAPAAGQAGVHSCHLATLPACLSGKLSFLMLLFTKSLFPHFFSLQPLPFASFLTNKWTVILSVIYLSNFLMKLQI